MNNPIKEIYKFNKEAGLLGQGYDDERECAFPIEEMLEGFKNLDLSNSFWGDGNGDLSPKNLSREIIAHAIGEGVIEPLPDVDRLDKHLDAIVFCFGSIFKLGLSPQQANKALGVVMKHNMLKLQAGQDEAGKQKKPDGFVGPEAELQTILDER